MLVQLSTGQKQRSPASLTECGVWVCTQRPGLQCHTCQGQQGCFIISAQIWIHTSWHCAPGSHSNPSAASNPDGAAPNPGTASFCCCCCSCCCTSALGTPAALSAAAVAAAAAAVAAVGVLAVLGVSAAASAAAAGVGGALVAKLRSSTNSLPLRLLCACTLRSAGCRV